ncbi:MAG: tRNA uridine-5-carboxymethylaminomethyl(34) synthesis GTPase MnmE [Sulfurimonas sp.]|nr:tRNA uridine-5-carboxymethylaminomethyl(34) synthesis GTPase MnmE [Sulfurimonadaceae bacterium]
MVLDTSSSMRTTHSNETIVAIATASGVGSIAIVRISGNDSYAIAQKLTKAKTLDPRYAKLTNIYAKDGSLLDEAIVIYFKAPHSFSGEDIVEIQCHGGYIVATSILEAALDYGARVALAGEFSKRAFLNGRIDLTQVEAIAALIEAKSLDAQKVLANQLKGELGKYVDGVRDEIISILAHSEVIIDYAEEDLPQDLATQIEQKLKVLDKNLTKTLRVSESRAGLMQGFRVAIVGKPNVGKSSLLNQLLSYDRAIVSDIAGTTRDTIEESLRIGSHLVKIVDTAGIREASDTIEQIGIQRSREAIEHCDIIVALFDNSREFDKEDRELLELLDGQAKEIIFVKNKIDLPAKFLDSNITFDISLNAKSSVEELLDRLELIMNKTNTSDEIMLISTRQIEAIKSATSSIQNSYEHLFSGELELFSFMLLEAIKSLTSITKSYDNEEVLDKMFSSFCLGK